MRWEIEQWRKLYIRRTAEWQRLPLSVRGLGRELIAYADDDGLVTVLSSESESVGEVLAVIMAAHANERERVISDVEMLMSPACKYIVRKGLKVYIRNFVEAQKKQSTSAARMARHRERKRGARDQSDLPVTPPVTHGDASHVTSPVTHGDGNKVTEYETKRNETKREGDVTVPSPPWKPPPRVPSNDELNQAAITGPRGDEIAALLNQTSGGKVDAMASADVLVDLGRIARTASPRPLTLNDFGLLWEAISADGALAWREDKKRRITLSWLTKDGGKHLLDGIVEAREWAERGAANHG